MQGRTEAARRDSRQRLGSITVRSPDEIAEELEAALRSRLVLQLEIHARFGSIEVRRYGDEVEAGQFLGAAARGAVGERTADTGRSAGMVVTGSAATGSMASGTATGTATAVGTVAAMVGFVSTGGWAGGVKYCTGAPGP